MRDCAFLCTGHVGGISLSDTDSCYYISLIDYWTQNKVLSGEAKTENKVILKKHKTLYKCYIWYRLMLLLSK